MKTLHTMTNLETDMILKEKGGKLLGFASQIKGQTKLNLSIPVLRRICNDMYTVIDSIVEELDKAEKR